MSVAPLNQPLAVMPEPGGPQPPPLHVGLIMDGNRRWAKARGLPRALGHKAGDQYICEASFIICEHFKHSPVFRIGGDEFAVVMEGADFQSREELVEAFNRQIEENLRAGSAVVSAGIAVHDPAKDANAHSVFTRADARMYERKRQLKSMGAVSRG